jgi:hypothetical protein
LTISNPGRRDLSLSGLSFTGPDPGDFVISSNSCLGNVAPGESCQLTISFAPQAPGSRTATLQIATDDYANSPLQVSLSGTGGSLPQGPTGPQGNTGAAGTPGPAGKVELITCRTVVKKIHGKRRKINKCNARQVSGTIKVVDVRRHGRLRLRRLGDPPFGRCEPAARPAVGVPTIRFRPTGKPPRTCRGPGDCARGPGTWSCQ